MLYSESLKDGLLRRDVGHSRNGAMTQGTELETASTSRKEGKFQRSLETDNRPEDHQASSRVFLQTLKNEYPLVVDEY
jgi:hypothetical protein